MLFEESPHFSKELPFLFFMFLYIVKETNRIRVFLLFQILFKKISQKVKWLTIEDENYDNKKIYLIKKWNKKFKNKEI